MPDLSREPETIDCVFVTCFTAEFSFLATLLRHSRVRLRRAETLEQADFLLMVTEGTVLLCDAVFLDGSWSDCAEMLARCHPRVSLLVLADEADGAFVRDAVGRGACAVSWKPLRYPELRGMIEAACEAAAHRAVLREAVTFDR
jgi:DNA-binding NtrC family response regulator